MLRSIWTSVSARSAVVSRSLAPAIARRSTLIAVGASCEPAHVVPTAGKSSVVPVPASSSRVPPIYSFSRHMCSARNQSKPTGDESHEGEGEAKEDTGSSSGGHSRDPLTGEGSWIDDEAEPLVLEKPKKVQKFCGKVISDKMDKSIRVAVPYWYHVKGLGRKVIRHSNIMAHDEENSCRIGDKVIIVDCKRKSKRKAHTLLKIVQKLPRLDDPS